MQLASEVRTEPLTCGIWCCLWADGVRTELNCRTPIWCQRIPWMCRGDLHVLELVTRISAFSFFLRKSLCSPRIYNLSNETVAILSLQQDPPPGVLFVLPSMKRKKWEKGGKKQGSRGWMSLAQQIINSSLSVVSLQIISLHCCSI